MNRPMDGRTDAVFALLEAGDANGLAELLQGDPTLAAARRADGVSATLWARYRGDEAALAVLLAAGPSLDGFDGAAVGDANAVRAALDADPTFANSLAADGFSALGLAAFFGHVDIARLMLGAGADPNRASRNAMRVAPLHSAVAGRHTAIAADLIAAGANVNAVQADGFTPLHEAAQNGDEPTVDLLLAAGADPTATKDDGQRPADSARLAGHPALASRLERAAADQ